MRYCRQVDHTNLFLSFSILFWSDNLLYSHLCCLFIAMKWWKFCVFKLQVEGTTTTTTTIFGIGIGIGIKVKFWVRISRKKSIHSRELRSSISLLCFASANLKPIGTLQWWNIQLLLLVLLLSPLLLLSVVAELGQYSLPASNMASSSSSSSSFSISLFSISSIQMNITLPRLPKLLLLLFNWKRIKA